jgi:hypothetical protein
LRTVRDLINTPGAVIDHVDFSAFGTVLDEYANRGDGDPGRKIIHSPNRPNVPIRVYIVVPRQAKRWRPLEPAGMSAEGEVRR